MDWREAREEGGDAVWVEAEAVAQGEACGRVAVERGVVWLEVGGASLEAGGFEDMAQRRRIRPSAKSWVVSSVFETRQQSMKTLLLMPPPKS